MMSFSINYGPGKSPCQDGYSKKGQKCYQVFHAHVIWDTAALICSSDHARLAFPNNSQELSVITKMIKKTTEGQMFSFVEKHTFGIYDQVPTMKTSL